MSPLPSAAPARATSWRARAERAGDRYQARAERLPLLGLPLTFLARYAARQGALLAGATAFRLFLWLLPLALVASGVLAAASEDHEAGLQRALDSTGVTGTTGRSVVVALQNGHRSWEVAVLVGAALLLWASRSLTRTLILVHAHISAVPAPRTSQRRLLGTSLVLDGCLLVVSVASASLVHVRGLGLLGVALSAPLRALLVAGAWLVVCLRLHSGRLGAAQLVPGCLLFGVGLTVLNGVSQVYLPPRFDRASQLYGSLGIASTMVAWLLIVGHLIVASALVNVVWADHRSRRAVRARADDPAREMPPARIAELDG